MEEALKEFLTQYGAEIIKTILMAILTAIAAGIKTVYTKYANTKTKKAIVLETVRYVEQIGKTLASNEKYQAALNKVKEQLNKVGIKYDELEIDVMIESAVNECFPHDEAVSVFGAEVSE